MSNRKQRPQRQLRLRRLAGATVEFAIVFPAFLVFIWGIIEFGRMLMVEQALQRAATEAARAAVTPEGTASDAIAAAQQVLAANGISGAQITITPADLANMEPGEEIKVEVTVASSQVRWLPFSILGTDAPLVGRANMLKEGNIVFYEPPQEALNAVQPEDDPDSGGGGPGGGSGGKDKDDDKDKGDKDKDKDGKKGKKDKKKGDDKKDDDDKDGDKDKDKDKDKKKKKKKGKHGKDKKKKWHKKKIKDLLSKLKDNLKKPAKSTKGGNGDSWNSSKWKDAVNKAKNTLEKKKAGKGKQPKKGSSGGTGGVNVGDGT